MIALQIRRAERRTRIVTAMQLSPDRKCNRKGGRAQCPRGQKRGSLSPSSVTVGKYSLSGVTLSVTNEHVRAVENAGRDDKTFHLFCLKTSVSGDRILAPPVESRYPRCTRQGRNQ